jgi:hypothetical protein
MLAARTKLSVRTTLRTSTSSFSTLSAARAPALAHALRSSAPRASVSIRPTAKFASRMSHGFGESTVRPEPDQVVKGLLMDKTCKCIGLMRDVLKRYCGLCT